MQSIHRSIVLALIAALPGCQRDLAGAACPCVEGFQCCATQNICIRAEASCPAVASAGASGAPATPAKGAAGASTAGMSATDADTAGASATDGGAAGASATDGGAAGAGGATDAGAASVDTPAPGSSAGAGGTIGSGGASGSEATMSSESAGSAGKANSAGTGGQTSDPLPRLVTSAPNAYWKTDGKLTEVTTGTADVAVNDAAGAQAWEGFGGAFNELGWKYLSALSEGDRELALRLLFGSDGARFNLGRVPMGASDYALDRYTLDEAVNDSSLASFSISRDMTSLIPYVKAALSVRSDIRLWANPWTPPTWMKSGPFTANSTSGTTSPFDGGTMKSDAATLQAYAQYFVKFVQQYAQQGITIDTVAPQNEPSYGVNHPSCQWDAATYTKFIGQYLGPALKVAKLDTHIMLGTMSNASTDAALISAVLADETAKSYVQMIGLQWDMLDNMVGAQGSGLPLWQTEHMGGNCPFSASRCASITPKGIKTEAPNDDAYAVESWNNIHDWIKAGVSSYSAWNLVLDKLGLGISSSGVWDQNALLIVDTSAKRLTITPSYWVFRHISQYVEPGATVVATNGGSALAFKNPGGALVTVMFNSGAAKTSIVSAAGKMFSFAMPARGWATISSQ